MTNMPAPPLVPVVAAALVAPGRRILLQRRPIGKDLAGLWEFPGGKIEPGECPESALARELVEELGVVVAPRDMTATAFASIPLGERHLLLLLFVVRRWQGEPRPLEAPELRWATLAEMRELPMPPADRPLTDLLDRLL